MAIIESSQNNIIKNIAALSQRKEREKQGLFLAEGLRFVNEIPPHWEIYMYVLSESFAEKNNNVNLRKDVKTVIVNDKLFNSISDTQTPQGIIAICYQKTYNISELLKGENPFLLLTEQVQDPGNLGTIIRTADAAGVNGIILSKGTVDLYNPKVLRATMGSIFHVPIIQNADIFDTLSILKENKILTLSAHLKGDKTPYSLNLKQPTAIIIGNEGNGISDEVSQKTSYLVKLPMLGKAESLNASIAAGILLYEVVRQRTCHI